MVLFAACKCDAKKEDETASHHSIHVIFYQKRCESEENGLR